MKLAVAYNDQEVETLGVKKSQNFGFSKDAEEMIFTMFTKNIYSNPIGSVVREITSNCFDSHKEAGVNEPVIIKLTKENSEFYISFVDVGVGMSPERITKVYAQYFNSTKRNDNNQIGGFGIGGKTPLAYAESFFLITIFEGVKYTYSIRKGTSSPVLDLLAKTKTIERNGTTIKIPVKSNDVYVFEREINRQLYYFENVIFEGFSGTVKNDYRIIEGKNFLYRGKDYNNYAHICLGRVAYPIDFNVLEDDMDDDFHTSNWNIPVAIKMEIGEINVTVSREAIDYTEATKKLIKKKLAAVKAELLELLAKQHEKLSPLEEYYRMEDESATLFLSQTESINIRSIAKHQDVVFKKLDELRIPSQAEVVHLFYDSSLFGKKKRRDRTWDKSLKGIANEQVYFVEEGEEMPRKKNAYMKATFKHFYSISRKDMSISDVKYLINKITPDKSLADTRTIFKQFRELQKEVFQLVESKTKKYSSIVVPVGFTVSSGKTYNPNQELPVTIDTKYGFAKERIKIADLVKSKATIYYGDLDMSSAIHLAAHQYEKLFNPQRNDKFSVTYSDYNAFPIRFIMVSKSNLKYITDIKNLKPISEFNAVLMRKRDTVIKFLEKKMFMERYEKLNSLFLNAELFNHVDKVFAKKITALKNLKSKYDHIRNITLNLDLDSPTIEMMKINLDTINYTGHDLFASIEKATEKNGMLAYVNVSSNFNPADKYVDKKDSENILKLLSLAYVK